MWGKLLGSAENSPGSKSVCVEVMMGLKFLILGKRTVFSLETWPKTHQFSCSMMGKSDSADVVWPPQKRQTINFNFCSIYILTGNSIVPVVCDFLSLCYVCCSIVSFRLYIYIFRNGNELAANKWTTNKNRNERVDDGITRARKLKQQRKKSMETSQKAKSEA